MTRRCMTPLLWIVSVYGDFTNPLCGLNCDTPDPWIQMVGNSSSHRYWWLYTSNPLQMRSASTLRDLATAVPTEVWRGDDGLWAPELHFWPAPYETWFIYCVNIGNDSVPYRIQVLESTSGSPAGPYKDRGFVLRCSHTDGGSLGNLLRSFDFWRGLCFTIA